MSPSAKNSFTSLVYGDGISFVGARIVVWCSLFRRFLIHLLAGSLQAFHNSILVYFIFSLDFFAAMIVFV